MTKVLDHTFIPGDNPRRCKICGRKKLTSTHSFVWSLSGNTIYSGDNSSATMVTGACSLSNVTPPAHNYDLIRGRGLRGPVFFEIED